MRKTLFTSILVLALCGSAFAGDIPSPPIAPGDIPSPPTASGDINNPPATSQMSSEQADGIASSDGTDSLTEAALAIINSVLALF